MFEGSQQTLIPMKRFSLITLAALTILVIGITVSIDAQSDEQASRKAQRAANHEARQQKRAQRLAEYERYVDSLVLSHNYRFVPQTMQQLPAGIMRNLVNPEYEVVVWSEEVDVCIPFLKGYTPPYYPVVFNYVLTNVEGYTAEQTSDGWHITFRSSLFSSTDYTFTLEIYSRYGGAMLTISSTFYNSVQYTGNIFAI